MTIANLASHFAPFARAARKDLVAPFTAAYGRAPEGELADWLRLAERHDVARKGFDGNPPEIPFRFLEPTVPTLEELVARVTDERLTVYELWAFLWGGVPIFVNDDPSVDYVSLFTRADGTSPVFYLGDAEAGTWPCAATLEAHLQHIVTAPRERRRSYGGSLELEPMPAHLDPTRLYARAELAMRMIHRVTAGSDEEDVARVGTRDEWARERPLVREWPHLAAHWIMQHMWFGHEAELAEVLSATKDMAHPIIQRLHRSPWVKPGGPTDEAARGRREQLRAIDPWRRG